MQRLEGRKFLLLVSLGSLMRRQWRWHRSADCCYGALPLKGEQQGASTARLLLRCNRLTQPLYRQQYFHSRLLLSHSRKPEHIMGRF
jgi:hypothetical protein